MSAVPGRTAGWLLAGLGALCMAGCTEDTLTGVAPGAAPGEGSATIEIELSSTVLPLWRDTTYTGYALPLTSGISLVAEGAELRSRVLARFSTLPDSVFLEDDRVPVERFESGRFRLVIDTVASAVPEAGAEISAYALTRAFGEREATWSQASAGEAWTTPGGDLGELLGTLQIDSLDADTVFVPIGADTDSLLKAWLAADGEPGLALLTETAGATLTLRQVALSFDVKPVGRDTLVETLRSPTPSTFIFDPETPATGNALRIGGLPAARTYLSFRLPESVDGVGLRGAQINRATLLFTSSGPPAAPFATTDTLLASAFSLLSDPFQFGPKTPVGAVTGSSVEIVPEEMGDGGELELPLTSLVQSWAAADPDSIVELNVGVRLLPEGGAIAFWEFGQTEDPARAPRVRILLTPATPFELP